MELNIKFKQSNSFIKQYTTIPTVLILFSINNRAVIFTGCYSLVVLIISIVGYTTLFLSCESKYWLNQPIFISQWLIILLLIYQFVLQPSNNHMQQPLTHLKRGVMQYQIRLNPVLLEKPSVESGSPLLISYL
ncbi:Hypothetical_protein [Hexamita inflata]|uniref:Hypothetical_protein n=1 Tax=Hexamita inflata TaxID=28002 RepID=A0AA86U3E8_9EUKA|nr:Hypothetical protein HINF_LOCUS24182 [Hexamita inflata]